ncbi:MAG: DNA polymerase III subunit gamma/tau [Leptolyngbya sp. PLA3]|nr:MAG: DNA polymerase III subunit gamma/tau [Cyanobacteria bacterium CYA]MCE7968429.1 DNA polymerase III subunit gamma/tau [Leptolyngbya sp. PL-A3]
MAYTVLARRYRSTSFDQVVGQEAIARTLRAAIEQDRVAHAYLFCGTRGVGKTSIARIFAKALNHADDHPEIAKAIMSGQDTDVIEIDAASNTGVDHARELIANANYLPMRGPYKVYIIDEVHMLSTAAFNALLKTMEEPPEHVKFVLCTTEAHKVPATIQSRCQRFDFRNIPVAKIAEHLSAVVGQEGLKAEPELVHEIARLGNGSMRDALSLLDRVIAAGEKKLTLALLEDLLGLPDRKLMGSLIDAIAVGDVPGVLQAGDELLGRGSGPDLFLESLTERLRDLMVLSACGPKTDLVELTGEMRREEAERAKKFDAGAIVHMIAICDAVQRMLRTSAAPKALVEAALVRLALSETFADAAALAAGSPRGPEAPAKKR